MIATSVTIQVLAALFLATPWWLQRFSWAGQPMAHGWALVSALHPSGPCGGRHVVVSVTRLTEVSVRVLAMADNRVDVSSSGIAMSQLLRRGRARIPASNASSAAVLKNQNHWR
jgi:hypothetical protein